MMLPTLYIYKDNAYHACVITPDVYVFANALMLSTITKMVKGGWGGGGVGLSGLQLALIIKYTLV